MANKRSGLGKGLGAILGETALEPSGGEAVTLLPLQKVEPNPLQPRKQFDQEALEILAESIAQHGVIQPLTVRKSGDYYQIIAGERRWRAARLAGLTEVPVNVIEADDREVMELALVENLQREDLNPLEEAQGYDTLMREFGLTQEQAAQRVGKSRPAVANALRLLSLDEDLAALVREGKLSAGHARALLPLKTPKQRMTAAQRVLQLQLSVRQTESLVKNMLKEPAAPAAPAGVDYVADCERSLTRRLGRRCRIVLGKKKGRVELEYYGEDDLNRLLEALEHLNDREEAHG